MNRLLSLILVSTLVLTPLAASAATRETADDMLKKNIETFIIRKTKPYTIIPTETYKVGPLSLKYPINWNPMQIKVGSYIGFSINKNADLTDLPRDSFMYIAIDPRQIPDMTTEQLDAYFIRGMTINATSSVAVDWYVPSFQLQSSEDTTLFGKPARRYKFTGEQSSVMKQGEEVVVSIGSNVYHVTYMSRSKSFAIDYGAFQKILETIKIVGEDPKEVRPVPAKTVPTKLAKKVKQAKAASAASSSSSSKPGKKSTKPTR